MRKVKFGVIGLGLMGREFGSAAARWWHLLTDEPALEIVGVCYTIDPGYTNRWFLEVYDLEASAKFTTDDPNAFTIWKPKARNRPGPEWS